MDVTNLKSIADLGAFGVILVILVVGLWLLYKAVAKYIEDKRIEDKEERLYHRAKIDEKDQKIEEITNKFTCIIQEDMKELKIEVKNLSSEIRRKNDK